MNENFKKLDLHRVREHSRGSEYVLFERFGTDQVFSISFEVLSAYRVTLLDIKLFYLFPFIGLSMMAEGVPLIILYSLYLRAINVLERFMVMRGQYG